MGKQPHKLVLVFKKKKKKKKSAFLSLLQCMEDGSRPDNTVRDLQEQAAQHPGLSVSDKQVTQICIPEMDSAMLTA